MITETYVQNISEILHILRHFLLFYLGGVRPIKPGPSAAPADVAAQESTDWLEMIWTFAASLVAPDDEEEGIHQLTETLTCKKNITPH